ncbi:MAG: sugar phosphate isomerase/epimerase family protein [Candidatus Hydrogenedentes bacterium]|nr:sugar phosphate isomerase/epimerase family protein [Candidatus Hydrogenedentota bacterium]
MEIFLHSYTFRDRPLREAFQAAKDFAYDGLELSRVHFDETRLQEELLRAVELGGTHNIPITCVDFAGDFFSEDEDAVKRSVALIEGNIGICAGHGIGLMNGYAGVLFGDPNDFANNGSALATDAHYEKAAAALRALGAVAGKSGVRLALEIHMNTIHDTVSSTRRLLDLVDSEHVVATPDPGNMYATSMDDRDPEALDPIRDRIGYFHFKSCREAEGAYDFSVGLANGAVDLSRYLHKLKELGYNGPVCIEHVGTGDPRACAREDAAYLRRMLKR